MGSTEVDSAGRAGDSTICSPSASRIYLRAHFLSDTIGGLALATAIYALVGAVALVIGSVRKTEGR